MARSGSTDKNLRVRELTVAAEESQLGRVRDFVVAACDEAAFSERETSNTKLAVDEACTNIIKHAYSASEQGQITVRVGISPGSLRITLRDRGETFDYASIQDPDLDEYVETGRKGGLGIYLINRLMDGVEYKTTDAGNELVLSKHSQSAISRGLVPLAARPLRGTLRFKFMLRASAGLLLLVVAIWAFVFIRQTSDIHSQRAARWLDERRLAQNLASRSKDALITPEEFSVEQTELSSYLAKLLEANHELDHVRVVDRGGNIVASGTIGEIFNTYQPPADAVELGGDKDVTWYAYHKDGRQVRDIHYAVRVTNPDSGQPLELGSVHLGVFEDAIGSDIEDPRLTVTLILIAVYLVGVLLIMGLVSVFVKPIQVLTDGVRAIGDGTFDAKLDVSGPAEIGAIAGVFNEITDKFKRAQESVLEQEKMQKEMEVAKEIQHSLLPRRKPEVSGYDIAPLYQAAAEVGGDYYDFVDVDEDTIGVVVADVSGKGVPGSLVMTMIRTALRMEARGNKNASDVMSKMNAFVTDDMKKGMFVTMFYVILDSKNRIISYASAGHNPMILYRHETHETFFLNPKGFPVGISLPDETLFSNSISLEKIKLKKDDMLLIYTDGVTEAMNERRDQYGEERLLALVKEHGHLHPEHFIAALERDIKKFTGGHAQNDDITVVAVKEKQSADDVLFGIRKKLIDLVDVEGMSVKDACAQMRVSPATYYRYKKRLEVMGERGLKNKVLREDLVLKRVSLEARKEILDIIVENPEFGAKRIATEYNADKEEARKLTERMVYDELKRLNLNTKELRIEYLRRHRLAKEEMIKKGEVKPDKELVEELLAEVSGLSPSQYGADKASEEEEIVESPAGEDRRTGTPVAEYDAIEGVGLNVTVSPDGVTTVEVNGHLDSVTSATLENRLKQLIEEGHVKFLVDLRDVTYISSGGWGIFTGEVRHLRQSGGDVVLVGMSPEVYDVYELLGFHEVLKAFPTQEEGHAYFELPLEDRLAVPSAPAADSDDATLGIKIDEELEEVPGESYVPEWESLHIDATTVGAQGDIAVLSLRGIIDTVSAERLRATLARVISGGRNKIVVDMSQVEYVSSGGWGTFTERLREVRRNDGDIKLFGMDPDVYYVFTMLGFNIVLSSFDILAEAIEDFETADRTGRRAPETLEEAGAPPRPQPSDRAAPARTPPESAPEIDLSHRDIARVVRWEKADDGVVIAHMSGYIESSAVDALAASMMQVLAGHPRAVLFDLEQVEYISSSGWGQFAKCYETVQEWNGLVALVGMSPALHELYSCLEFSTFIAAYNSRGDAFAALAGTGGDVSPDETDAGDRGGVWMKHPSDSQETGFIGSEEPMSIDDILDVGGAEPQESAETGPETPGPATPELQRWPGERVFGDDEDDETEQPSARDDLVERLRAVEDPEVEHAPEIDLGAMSEDAEDTEDTPGSMVTGESPASEEATEPPELEDETETRRAGFDDEPRPVPGIVAPEDPFIDISDSDASIDVGSAITDKNIDRDERIRKMGWEDYGERLRKRNEPKKKKD
jgi:anti-anti-sigma factor